MDMEANGKEIFINMICNASAYCWNKKEFRKAVIEHINATDPPVTAEKVQKFVYQKITIGLYGVLPGIIEETKKC